MQAATMAHQNLSHAGGLTHSVIKGVHEKPSGAQDAVGTSRLHPDSGSANHPSLIRLTRSRETPPCKNRHLLCLQYFLH